MRTNGSKFASFYFPLFPFISLYFPLFPFISFYFPESRLIKGLRVKKIEKFSSRFDSRLGCGWNPVK